jgi:23S rRNA (guanosine2251-2'-O)-methyltransferase
MSPQITLILHNIRSVHNVGAIFRTADAVGVEEIILSGYTPTPLDRFHRLRKDFVKTALGAECSVPWRQARSLVPEIKKLQMRSVQVVAVEQAARAVPYKMFTPAVKTALVLGNEVRGLSQAVLRACDAVVYIPMRGSKESLNVSVAAGVVLYGLFG